MKKEIYLTAVLFSCLLFTTLVIGVGGGGGGSAGSASGGGSPVFSEVHCFDDGHIELQMDSEQEITATDSRGKSIPVKGHWDAQGNFLSEELVFSEAGKYSITNNLGTSKSFTCPGYQFACSAVNLMNAFCIKNSSGIFAGFDLTNDSDIHNLAFHFTYGQDKKIASYNSQSKSPVLNNLLFSSQGIHWIVNVAGFDANSFEVVHEKCLGKNYIYSRVDCSTTMNLTFFNPQELKCGGLLNLNDRVRCRINLREDQKDEYENFYPEECRNNLHPDICYQLYWSVKNCWGLLTGEERIQCLKKTVGLGDIDREKAACSTTDCKKIVNEKLFSFIKLRLYHLEEQAEILADRGYLGKEDLISFVTEIEQKKFEFNHVAMKDEKRKILEDVRGLWSKLMERVHLEGK